MVMSFVQVTAPHRKSIFLT